MSLHQRLDAIKQVLAYFSAVNYGRINASPDRLLWTVFRNQSDQMSSTVLHRTEN